MAEQSAIDQKVRELYPMLVIYLDHPEIGPILRTAAKEGWTSPRLEGAVQETQWWQNGNDRARQLTHLKETNPGEYKTQLERKIFELHRLSVSQLGFGVSPNELKPIAEHALQRGLTDQQALKALQGLQRYRDKSETERQFVSLALLDPETLNQRIQMSAFDLRATANEIGVNLGDQEVLDLATEVFRDGWTSEQVHQHLVKQVDWENTDRLAGAAGEAIQNVRRISSDYLVPLSDQAQKSWAASVLGGDEDLSAFTEYARKQAVSRFPTMEAALDRGLTAQEFVEPYRQLVSQFWEVAPNEVDFMDENMWTVLDGAQDEKGERRAMTLSETAKWLRSQEKFQETDQFRHKVADLSEHFGKQFGLIA